ncbi:MAG: hypothetical protein IJ088_01140, partial [Clostridia bacterium]|nr:hypothetical protein [Clostridia bacterium]
MRKMGKDVLLGKIVPDDPDGKIIPPRPKKQTSGSAGNSSSTLEPESTSDPRITATRPHVGSKEILDAIAEKSGIEEDIYALLEKDVGTAQKL